MQENESIIISCTTGIHFVDIVNKEGHHGIILSISESFNKDTMGSFCPSRSRSIDDPQAKNQ